jgi:hypothetical protein
MANCTTLGRAEVGAGLPWVWKRAGGVELMARVYRFDSQNCMLLQAGANFVNESLGSQRLPGAAGQSFSIKPGL